MPSVARIDPLESGLGKKNMLTGSHTPFQRVAGKPSMGPLAVSLVPQMQVQPDNLDVKFHMRPLGSWCNEFHRQSTHQWEHTSVLTLPGEAAHKVPLKDQTVWKDPNAGEQHVFGSPGKLLHVLLRLVVVPAANAVNPFLDPVSFAM